MSNSPQNNDTTPVVSDTIIISTRPQQKGTLALLPTEILYKIAGQTKPLDRGPIESRLLRIFNKVKTTKNQTAESSALSITDLKNLGLASSSLFYHIRPLYYRADNFRVFRSALEHADVDIMGRCAEFDAAPDMHWDLQYPCRHQHLTHKPVDVLLESARLGLSPIGKSIKALQWLMDHDYDVYEQKLHRHDIQWARASGGKNWMRKLDPLLKSQRMPEVLIHLVNVSTDRDQTEGICQMIRMLLTHGCLLPYNLGRYKPLDIAMRSHFPPCFLELVLDQFKQHDARVKEWRDDCPESMIKWVGYELWIDDNSLTERLLQRWAQMSCLAGLACRLFDELIRIRQMCKERYYGDISDVFEEKVKLLIKYEFVDETEQRALVSIVEALRDITSMIDPSENVNFERDGEACWTRLFNGLRISAADENIASVWETSEGPQRIHRFIFDETRNPWSSCYRMTLNNESHWSEFSRPWLKEEGLSKLFGQVEDPVWDDLVEEASFKWHEFDYHGYVMKIGQLWMEKEEQRRKETRAERDSEED
ncbi:hypothetical protein NW768_007291 [Fusarium equiseti]|uniref:F-box domain-containing protein n=1 Tax=Fusarium equiseti TaxID=61235 RepID=A0ABQ8RAM1_FUSEQ|nr:hypothetical protein NW768_007291 [Fusarium equiseti]